MTQAVVRHSDLRLLQWTGHLCGWRPVWDEVDLCRDRRDDHSHVRTDGSVRREIVIVHQHGLRRGLWLALSRSVSVCPVVLLEVTQLLPLLHLVHSDPLVASLTKQAGHGVGVVASVRLIENAPQLLARLSEVASQLLPQLLMMKGVRSCWSFWDDANACFGLHRNRSSDLTP